MKTSTYDLPQNLATAVEALRLEWDSKDKLERLWNHDSSLWTGQDEGRWLGWLDAPNTPANEVSSWSEFGREVRDARFSDALLLGMGGSSLCPEVLSQTFGRQTGFPTLHVLDSTDPAQIQTVEAGLDLRRTLCIVASKSGSTLEPKALMSYFWDRIRVEQSSKVGASFVAITDLGSELDTTAQEFSFRRTFFGTPSIGGRFSALSAFGMVPGAVAGIDVWGLMSRAREMAEVCHSTPVDAGNPGVDLGLVLGAAALEGRDKMTILASEGIRSLGAWLEQLIAESTGKQGRAIIPVDVEPVIPVESYGDDRIFVDIRLGDDPGLLESESGPALVEAGHPVISIRLSDEYDLGGEFFCWEFATAVAGSVLGVNPFDQPDVEASKIVTRELTDIYERSGSLPEETPAAKLEDMALFGDPEYLVRLGGADTGVEALLCAHIDEIRAGDYFALLAFVEMDIVHEILLQDIRRAVLERKGVATCLGFGPRFLHSTGQAYKGGPDTGVFLQITASDPIDLPVPNTSYSFGTIETAQARGDFAVLVERHRRALRLHLEGDTERGLHRLLQFLT